MSEEIRDLLRIPASRLDEINDVLLDPDMTIVEEFLNVVAKYGTPEEINQKAKTASDIGVLRERLSDLAPDYISDLDWVEQLRDENAFIKMEKYRQKVLGDKYETTTFSDEYAVTLEISACQYFPYFVACIKRAIENDALVPGRFIRVRKMKEQEEDGDLLAMAAAMQIIGASYVETLDTKGTDGSNIHLGGPETITGYFGGVGQPNEYALKWLDEYLY